MIPKFSIVKSLLFAFISVITFQNLQAQNGQMNEQQMRQMMQNAQKMQECFADIDQSALEALEARGKKMEAEVKALCKAGKRDQAQQMALAYGREINASKDMQAMKKCGTMSTQMMQNSPFMAGNDSGHICDAR